MGFRDRLTVMMTGHADADGDSYIAVLADHGNLCEVLANGFRSILRPFQVRISQQNHKLIAAKSRGNVGRPAGAQQVTANRLQGHVSRLMTVTVIDTLEIVDVKQDH